MRVTPFPDPAPRRVVVTHENITALKNIEESLKKTASELKFKTRYLQESSMALKVLLRQTEQGKREYEQNVLSNFDALVKPYLHKLKKLTQNPKQRLYIDVIETNLEQMLSSPLNRITSIQSKLTPQEIRVANLIRNGKTTKEIAEILIVSVNSVHFYRKNIRKKLGLKQKKTNLQSYLLSSPDGKFKNQ
jgi:DNA-binding CsgD family transcriptional regulator